MNKVVVEIREDISINSDIIIIRLNIGEKSIRIDNVDVIRDYLTKHIICYRFKQKNFATLDIVKEYILTEYLPSVLKDAL